MELIAKSLLRRYGVVFKRLLERETALPPWRHLLWTFRRLEARGEVRGGRFVAGFSGEQFALEGAVEALRRTRKASASEKVITVNATDPLNLVGIIVPGLRIPAKPGTQIAYIDGEPIAVRLGDGVRLLKSCTSDVECRVRTALIKKVRPVVRRRYARR
jgi:ATP-dependent Lhr-like helicase